MHMIKSAIKHHLRALGKLLFPPPQPDIRAEMARLATSSTASYVLDKMPLVQSRSSAKAVIDDAFAQATLDGLILEFGVFQGGSIRYLADKTPDAVHGFDAFEGLPSAWRDGFPKGSFRLTTLPSVPDNVVLHVGWFDETLPRFLASIHNGSSVRLLHVDCDLYTSTNTVLAGLEPFIGPGTVIIFDEYFNYPGWELGEFRSFQEFIARTGLSYEYLSYNRLHEQVAIRIIRSSVDIEVPCAAN
jgi:hypothetical protein